MKAWLLSHPYREYTVAPVRDAAKLRRLVAGGTLIAFEIGHKLDDEVLGHSLREIRRHVPWAVFVGRIREQADPELMHTVRLATLRGLRAFVHDTEPLELTLRRILSSRCHLDENVASWLEDVACTLGAEVGAGLTETPEIIQFVRDIFRQPPDEIDADELVARSLLNRRLRRLLRSIGLPAPAAWTSLALRLLPDALDLQQQRHTSLAAFAIEHGWSDQSALTRAFTHAFGWTPAQASRRLGWEWLAYSWLERRVALGRTN